MYIQRLHKGPRAAKSSSAAERRTTQRSEAGTGQREQIRLAAQSQRALVALLDRPDREKDNLGCQQKEQHVHGAAVRRAVGALAQALEHDERRDLRDHVHVAQRVRLARGEELAPQLERCDDARGGVGKQRPVGHEDEQRVEERPRAEERPVQHPDAERQNGRTEDPRAEQLGEAPAPVRRHLPRQRRLAQHHRQERHVANRAGAFREVLQLRALRRARREGKEHGNAVEPEPPECPAARRDGRRPAVQQLRRAGCEQRQREEKAEQFCVLALAHCRS